MKGYSYNEKVIEDVISELKKQDIDLYLIITAEGCDPITTFIPGVDTVGASAYLFTKEGKKIAIASSIDAQDVEESELFDEVRHYDKYDDTLAEVVKTIAPKRLALNFSEKNAFCDGLTLGKYQKFVKSLEGVDFEIVSSDLFIPIVQEKNKR